MASGEGLAHCSHVSLGIYNIYIYIYIHDSCFYNIIHLEAEVTKLAVGVVYVVEGIGGYFGYKMYRILYWFFFMLSRLYTNIPLEPHPFSLWNNCWLWKRHVSVCGYFDG